MKGKISSKLLDYAECAKAQQMYQELDSRGRRLHSVASLAELFGVGETTMYRVVTRSGPYRNMEPPKGEDEVAEEAAAALERLKAAMAEETPGLTQADQMLTELSEAERKAKELLYGK